MAKQKYYVVWIGKNPGVYDNWNDCKAQIEKYPKAIFKAFKYKDVAEKAFHMNHEKFFDDEISEVLISEEAKKIVGEPELNSIAVDAACKGNPGIMEYQGVDTMSGAKLFKKGPFPEGTINIGEFLAIVHALAYLKERNSNIPVYSDSKTAIKWTKDKKINTGLQKNQKNEKLFIIVERALGWLQKNTYQNKIMKWETKYWGEIPADFGRK